MSTQLLISGLIAGLFAPMFAYEVFTRYDAELGDEACDEPSYSPLIHGGMLPILLLVMLALSLWSFGTGQVVRLALTLWLSLLVQLSLYDALLLALLPLLRRRISARTCAMLWLLPTFLYLSVQRFLGPAQPLWMIHASTRLVLLLFALWLLGFLVLLCRMLVSHLLFRRALLRRAVPVTDEATLCLLEAEAAAVGLHRQRLRLVRTPDTQTPLSIGLFRRTTRIVLPPQTATAALPLILRHELVHIARRDSWAKFFMQFCTALCWFNPLVWVAMRRSAEDTERSCDETVLLRADEPTRRQYADLILRTAGDVRGFTTCLSTSAACLRYRLRAIVHPGKRSSGALAASLLLFALLLSSGLVSLAYGEQTGTQTIFRAGEPGAYTPTYIARPGGTYKPESDCIDTQALTQYLAGLRTQELTGNYSFSGEDELLTVFYEGPDGQLAVDLYADCLKVFSSATGDTRTYHLPEGADPAYLDQLLPPLPQLTITLLDDAQHAHSLTIHPIRLVHRAGATEQLLRNETPAAEDLPGVISSQTFTEAALEFSMPLTGAAEVQISSLDGAAGETHLLSGQDLHVPLPALPVQCTVTAFLQAADGEYEAVFAFSLSKFS